MEGMRLLTLPLILLAGWAPAQQKVTEIPFELVGEYIMVPVTIQDTRLSFVFDTGATSTVLDSTTAVALKITPQNQTTAQGASGSSNYQLSKIASVNIHDVELKNLTAIHVSLLSLSRSLGSKIDGIIGNDVLLNRVTEINYDTRMIRLLRSVDESSISSPRKLPFTFVNFIPIPAIDLSFTLTNGKQFSEKFLVDTGAGLTMILNTPFIEQNDLYHQVGKTITSTSKDLTSKTVNQKALFQHVQIDEFIFSEVPVTLSGAKKGVNGLPGLGGILGNEILKQFNMVLDYPNQIIYLKKNQMFGMPFYYPMAGFKLESMNDRLIVSEVNEKTPAAENGILIGYELIQIDDYTGKDMQLIRKRLNTPGEVRLVFKNNGQLLKVNLFLKRLI
jgi:predicted aspartyl protease